MARLTVSYSIAFIPGLPRPLVLSEVIDDVVGLSSLSFRHTVRKAPGRPERLDIIVPVDDLQTALDAAADAADELTRIGESLLGLGFVVEERAIRVDGLADNWLPDTFDGAGTRHHASTDLDAAAPLPDHLEEPTGDVPDEDLRLDKLTNSPAADQPSRRFVIPDHVPAPPPPHADADADAAGDDRRFASPRDGAPPATLLPSASGRPPVHRTESAAIVRRRDRVRQLAVAPGAVPSRSGGRGAYALFAVALIAVIAPWGLAVSLGAIAGLALVAAALVAGAVALWSSVRGFAARAALTGAATLAVVLAFASAYAVCARDGDLHGTGARSATVGQALSAAVSVGAAPSLSLGPGARSIAYGQRLLVLLALAGVGAQLARTTRRGV